MHGKAVAVVCYIACTASKSLFLKGEGMCVPMHTLFQEHLHALLLTLGLKRGMQLVSSVLYTVSHSALCVDSK